MKKSINELRVWHDAMSLTESVYLCTAGLPPEERYGLTSQMRRAAISIACNIAEGKGRRTDGEFLQFLGMSRGSLLELKTQVLLGERLGFIEPAEAGKLSSEIEALGRRISSLMNAIESTRRTPSNDQ